MLLIVFCFGRGIRVVHRLLFWEGDPSCSSVFVLGGGSLLRIVLFVLGGGSMLFNVVCFEREFRVAHRFFVLGGGSVLFIVFCFGSGIRVAYPFLI